MGQQLEDNKNKLNKYLHHFIAIVGGFLAGYAIIERADFLGNAQTANLIYIVFAVLGRNVFEFALRIGAVLIYFLSGIIFVYIKRRTSFNVKYVSVAIDVATIFILYFIPENINPIIALYPIFFAMSFQWNSFPGSYGYVSSTIFSTNNVRQVSLAIGEYLFDGSFDRKHLDKARFFVGTIVFFHTGVVAAYFGTAKWHAHSILLALIPFIVILPMIHFESKITEEFRLFTMNERNNSKISCKSV